jgi:hypothetical protein
MWRMRGTPFAPAGAMQRIVAALSALVAVGGWLTPCATQRASSRVPSLRAASYIYLTPNPFLGALTARVQRPLRPSPDRRALRAVAIAMPARASLSTEHLTRLPTRVSWTPSHTALASAFVVTLLIDAAQTRALARQGWAGFRESNPLLGERPSVGRVNSYTALAGLSVLGVAAAAPPRWRPWLLGAAVAVQAFTIQGSVRRGLPIRFP